MKNLKTLSIEEVEAINNYLETNPQYDGYDQPVEMDDLDVDGEGNIVYAYRWKTRSYTEEGHGFHTITENYDEEYQTLLQADKLRQLVENAKGNN